MDGYRELLKGSLDLIILSLLERESMYGYQMIKEIQTRSADILHMKEGSLYPALHRLEHAGLIESSWQRRDDGVDRRYYRMTPQGAAAFRNRQEAWRRFVIAVEGVFSHGTAA